jgi:DNA-binding CsgD family transcriptional regulator
LSTREKEVLTLLGEGKSSKEIADLLYISSRTVEHHRASINKKLKVKNIVELVKYAIRKGYTSRNI